MLVSPERVERNAGLAAATSNEFADFVETGPVLVAAAREARETHAISYRGFLVGGAGLVQAESGLYAVLYGANNSPYQGAPKRCAEVEIMQKAVDMNFSVLRGLVVAATSDKELIAGVMRGRETATLPPCHDPCQGLLERHMTDPNARPGIDSRMPVLTVGFEENVHELRSVGGLLVEHGVELEDVTARASRLSFADPGGEHWFNAEGNDTAIEQQQAAEPSLLLAA